MVPLFAHLQCSSPPQWICFSYYTNKYIKSVPLQYEVIVLWLGNGLNSARNCLLVNLGLMLRSHARNGEDLFLIALNT